MTVARTVALRCAAKINIYLDVIRKRDDGYHDIETVFQPIALFDTIRIRRTSQGISLSGNETDIPWDRTNLCWKAAELIMSAAPSGSGVSIEVDKRIPAGAGLGGGSSDAAGVLSGIDELFGLGLGRAELMRIALEIGSDVPFFIFGHPAVGRGRGEILEEISGLRKGTILIVKPRISISTKWAYQNPNLILTRSGGGHKLKRLLEGLKGFPDIALETHNSFQKVVVEEYPEIGKMLVLLEREGAILSSMSGSGSACFALFGDEAAASNARDRMLGEGHSVWLTDPAGQTQELLRGGESRNSGGAT